MTMEICPGLLHASDCATNNAPAFPAGDCDCETICVRCHAPAVPGSQEGCRDPDCPVGYAECHTPQPAPAEFVPVEEHPSHTRIWSEEELQAVAEGVTTLGHYRVALRTALHYAQLSAQRKNALEPFAQSFSTQEAMHPDMHVEIAVTVGDLRRAKSAWEGKE